MDALRASLTAKEAELAEVQKQLEFQKAVVLELLDRNAKLHTDYWSARNAALEEAARFIDDHFIRALMTSPAPDREARELALLEWYWQLVGHEMYGDREQLGYPEPGNFAACLVAFNATQKDKSDD